MTLMAASGCGRSGSRLPLPNVILVSLDGCRADHLSCYGYGRATTPWIDSIAASGVRFANVISTSSACIPAHMSLMTALPPTLHGVIDWGSGRLDRRQRTLAESFASAGYATVGFASGPALHPSFGFDRGFDQYLNCSAYMTPKDFRNHRLPKEIDRIREESSWDATNPTLFRRLLNFVENTPPEPFFVFAHVADILADYQPPPPYDSTFDPDYAGTLRATHYERNPSVHPAMAPRDLEHVIALYDGEIAACDRYLARLAQSLEREGLRPRTLVVITADHGEEFFEHGNKGHAKSLFDEVLRVPLVLSWPGRLPPREITEQVRLLDIAPTLVDLCGLPPSRDAMGRSLVPMLKGERESRPAYAELTVPDQELDLRSAQTTDAKIIWNRARSRPDEHRAAAVLYDLAADPAEQAPLPATSDLAAPMVERLNGWLQRIGSRLADREEAGRDSS